MRDTPQIQRDGADILVLKYLASLATDEGIAFIERQHGVEPGAIDRILQRIDALQAIADAHDQLNHTTFTTPDD